MMENDENRPYRPGGGLEMPAIRELGDCKPLPAENQQAVCHG